MHYLAIFFVGALVCNAIPHLIAGLQGKAFPTPFAKPHGVGDSSSLINFIWSIVNLLIGIYIFSRSSVLIGFNSDLTALFTGFTLMGIFLSIHFGNVQKNKRN